MKENIESKIRLNAILIYIIVALLCGGMLIYLYNQKERVGLQKQDIEKNRRTLMLTNKLISFVNYAQANANLYIISKRPEYILQFTENMQGVQSYIDSLKPRSPQEIQITILDDIEFLLNKKARTISDLNVQFDTYNLVDSISKNLRMYELSLLNDAFSLGVVNQTTMITSVEDDSPQKGFFKRLAEAFVPKKKAKKDPKEVTTTTVDTLHADLPSPQIVDTTPMLSELLDIAHKTNKKYADQITFIEKQVASLMASDHEISVQLSNLLIDLHLQTINSTMEEIHKSEELIRRNYASSIIGALISLVLVLTLIIFIIRNANRGHEMRKAMERANILTKKTFESRHKLVLSISHDIKTPINSILGYLELWEHGHAISPREIAAMQYSGKHILELMENLLEFSRLDQGLMQVTPTNFSLQKLCSDIIELSRPLALQKKLSFEVHLNFDKSLQLHSDELKIKQVVINVLSNAIKYTVKGSVQFNVDYLDGNIRFGINDTGKGIPADQIDKIFDAFMRIEENNSLAQGSGFGLFIAKGMTNLLKGSITIHSTVGKGTQAMVILPVCETSFSTTAVTALTFKRILVIDDDLVFLSMLKEMLLKLGHQIDACHTMEECEKLSKQVANYDIILTDADMVTFSGKDILQKMKDKGVKLPVILMSGRSDLSDMEAVRMGFNGFLRKPVTITSLRQIFGGNEKISDELPSLEELFGGDKEVIQRVLNAFVQDTTTHIALLEQASAENDFVKAKKVCHKMLPMFIQMGAKDAVVILSKINESRGEFINNQLSWKEEIFNLINISNDLINKIKNNNL